MTSSGVMRFQAGIKAFCETDIESFLIDIRLQDVNIIKFHPPSPKGFGAIRIKKNGLLLVLRSRIQMAAHNELLGKLN